MTKHRLTLLIAAMAIALAAAACGGTPADAPAAPPVTATPLPAAPPAPDDAPAAVAPDNQQAAPSTCENTFGFCVTAKVSGSVLSEGTMGFGSSTNTDCAAWAAGGDARILELPLLLGAGTDKITVALSRIGAYQGPGTYELAATATGGAMPDLFPTLDVAGRAFSSGDGSTATVTVAADGSGSLQAAGLVEIASVQVSNPDPNARIDLSLEWTCQEAS